MINQQKLILMSKLAVYDKRFAAADKKANDYFRGDYVHHKNARTRLFVFLGAVILLVFYWTHKIVVDKVDVLSLDLLAELRNNGVFILIALAFYTCVGWVREVSNYGECMERLRVYSSLLGRLDKLAKREASSDGASFTDTGSGRKVR
jgi:hypothetical protein